MPLPAKAWSVQSRMRRPPTIAKHLGVSAVVGMSRMPRPAPMMMACMGAVPLIRGGFGSVDFSPRRCNYLRAEDAARPWTEVHATTTLCSFAGRRRPRIPEQRCRQDSRQGPAGPDADCRLPTLVLEEVTGDDIAGRGAHIAKEVDKAGGGGRGA